MTTEEPFHTEHTDLGDLESEQLYLEAANILQKLQLDKPVDEEWSLDDMEAHIEENLQDEFVQEALTQDIDLVQYSEQIQEKLQVHEKAFVQDFIGEANNIANLHMQISSCDKILESMDHMLRNFQNNLANISNEIRHLQQYSAELNIKKKNRELVRGQLSQVVDEMVVPQSMIQIIMDVPVTERQFLEQLHELSHKIKFVKEQSFHDAIACQDVQEVLEKLRIKTISKIREFILQKIYQFRKPMTNYEVPQNALLRNRFFYEFLLTNDRQIADEIRREYIDTLSKVYFSYFKAYSSKLMKLQLDEKPDKDDVLGADDRPRSNMSFFSTTARPHLKHRATVFSLGNRDCVLKQELEAPIMIPHAQQKAETKYPYEYLFRSEQYALLDNCCREYLFLCDFFMLNNRSAPDFFMEIFEKTFKLIQKNVEIFILESYDPIAILLCMHLLYRYQVIANKRNVPILNKFHELLIHICENRFEIVMKTNIDSVQRVEPHKFSSIELNPHFIVRRYAEFSGAVTRLNEEFANEKISTLMTRLQVEILTLILRMANEFPQRKEQLIFIINNYDLILSVLTAYTNEDSPECDAVKNLLRDRIDEYVKEVLIPYFSPLITFVRDSDQFLSDSNIKQLENKLIIISKLFTGDFKKTFDLIHNDVIRSFPSLKLSQPILKEVFTQFLSYYHDFQRLLSNNTNLKTASSNISLPNVHQLMVEIKKFKLPFDGEQFKPRS
ncbi:unnamed protein product [Rotaria sp. Silwood1]|nr:unnamed protein product [Rotaria sp. Silwood1]CAF1324448.1 unnamed protein product [Rotaria sp. Silwood1]CAF1346824.1 unnamed protein product [Rotaria sp. Silwood1]CAF3549358.1 unnamed protein product [Rotaria sp. Silwood1]CAF3564624.1 unnamed protein product [Rotaria sp. Silwood1]